MTKATPDSIALPALGEMSPGKPVLKSTWQTLIAAQHYAYGRQGNHVLNLVFDPHWQSLDYSSGGDVYHSVGDETGSAGTAHADGIVQLEQRSSLFQFQRLEYNTGNADQGYQLIMQVYAKNLDVRVSCVRFNNEGGNSSDTTTVHTLTSSHDASNSEWQVDTQEFTKAEASRDGSTGNGLAYFYLFVDAKVPASGIGYLHQVAVRENLITASANLPRGA